MFYLDAFGDLPAICFPDFYNQRWEDIPTPLPGHRHRRGEQVFLFPVCATAITLPKVIIAKLRYWTWPAWSKKISKNPPTQPNDVCNKPNIRFELHGQISGTPEIQF